MQLYGVQSRHQVLFIGAAAYESGAPNLRVCICRRTQLATIIYQGRGGGGGGGVTIALEPIKVTPRNVSNFLPRSSSFFPSFRRVFGKIALTVPPEIYDFRFAFITPPLPLPLSWRETFLSRGGGAPRFRNEKKYFSSPNSNFSSGIFATMIEIMAGKRKGMEMMENGKEWILRVERFE